MTSAGPVIEVADVSKRYRRPPSEVPRRIRHLRDLSGREKPWALRGISFEVRRGESVGLLGTNGSGKSSLLRLLAGTARPTSGTVTVHEPAYGLLSLGEGAHPLLTGRENAVTGAMLAGLTRSQAEAAVPEIAAFSELQAVIDTPLRTYSEGMKLRLAFATSMVVDPRVLLIDEVLAVGDLRFRERCLRRLRELRDKGVTTVFVSHDLSQVRDLCDRALWLKDGRVHLDGTAEHVVEQYELAMLAVLRKEGMSQVGEGSTRRTGNQRVEVTDVRLRGPGSTADVLRSGSAVTVEVDYANRDGVPDAVLAVSVHDAEGRLCLDLSTHGTGSGDLGASGTLALHLDRLDLADGTYGLDVGLYDHDWSQTYDYWWHRLSFTVSGTPSRGVLAPPHRWGHEPA